MVRQYDKSGKKINIFLAAAMRHTHRAAGLQISDTHARRAPAPCWRPRKQKKLDNPK
jgi:hypothetical protein